MRIDICAGVPGRKLATWHFEHVTLTGKTLHYPNTLIRDGERLVSPYNERTMSTGVTTSYPSGEYEPATETVSDCPGHVFFFIYNMSNYFHFVYDTLPYLLEYLRLRDTPPYTGIRLLMSEPPKYAFVYDALRLLDILPEHITYATSYSQYESLWITNSMTHDGESNEPPRSDIWELYARMKTAAFQQPMDTPKKFYVSRRTWVHGDLSNIGTNYTTRRRMMVEDELVERLKEKGYEEVFCEKLSMAEKIQYFANATHIVGAIGGGMCNLVFARPECVVVSINSPEFDTTNRRFLHTMTHTQLTQFRDTYTVGQTYRRVRIGEDIGEIVEDGETMLQVNMGNGVTWNESDPPNLRWVNVSDVTFLDNGLNSPWSFDVDKCMVLIQ